MNKVFKNSAILGSKRIIIIKQKIKSKTWKNTWE